VQKTIGSNQTVYVYDAFGLLAAEYSNVASSSPCSPCYLSTDQLGSTRLVTDANREVLARHDYLPFGEEVPANQAGRDSHWGPGNDAIAQKFTGQERDAEGPELDFFQARYYSGTQGRFNSPDPGNAGADLTNPQSWNAYAYVLNNPLNNVDPDGLDSMTTTTPGFDLNGHPTASGGGAPSTLGFGGGGFGFSWGGGVPRVVTISAAHLPYANGPLDVFVGGAKQAAYDAVDSLSRFVNGDHPTEATNWLLWQLRPTTQKQQAGGNALGVYQFVTMPESFTGLRKMLASEAQVAEILSGSDKAIAGAGTKVMLRDAQRLANQYGGKAEDWVKIRSSNFKAPDAAGFEIHAYKNMQTGKIVELKTKFQ